MVTTRRFQARSGDGRSHEVRITNLGSQYYVVCDACGTRRRIVFATQRGAAERHLAEHHGADHDVEGERTTGWYVGAAISGVLLVILLVMMLSMSHGNRSGSCTGSSGSGRCTPGSR